MHSKITHVSYDDQQAVIQQAHFDVFKGKVDQAEYEEEEEFKPEDEEQGENGGV